MQKRQLLIISLLATIFIAGCIWALLDMQTTNVGKLILNQDQIKTIGVVEGPTDGNTVKLSDSVDISILIDMINEIPVKRLTKQADINFMHRIQEAHLAIYFDDHNNPIRPLQGMLLIWPDGYIYTVDVGSMTGNQRTISYLSESKYPEIYEWINDKLI
jgi:hypothetical protein